MIVVSDISIELFLIHQLVAWYAIIIVIHAKVVVNIVLKIVISECYLCVKWILELKIEIYDNED